MPTLAVDTEVSGVDEAVGQLARVDQAAEQVAQKTTRRFSKTVQEIRDEIEWTEAIEAAKKRLGTETTKVNVATTATGAAARTVGSNVQAMASKLSSATSAVASLSGAIGTAGDRRVLGLASSMAGAVAQGAAMGAALGPAGSMVGGILGAAIPALRSLTTEIDSATLATARLEAQQRRLADFHTSQDASRERLARSAIDAGNFGLLNSAEVERYSQEAEAAIHQIQSVRGDFERRLQALIRSAGDAPEGSRRREEYQRQARELTETLRAQSRAVEQHERVLGGLENRGGELQRQSAAPSEALGINPAGIRRAGGGGDAQSQADRDETARLQAAFEREQEIARQRNEAEQRRLDDAERNRAAEIAAHEELNTEIQRLERERFETSQRELRQHLEENKAAFNEAYAEFATGAVSSIDQVREAWAEANNAMKLSGGQMMTTSRLMERTMVAVGNNIADTIGGTMTSAFEQALGAWLDGSESFVEAAENMVKGVIKALVLESIVQAVVEFARGLTSLAGQDYVAAPQHFAAAAAWAAVAGVAGGIGAGIGAFGGGGEKKDDGGGGDARSMGAGSVREESASQNVVINVFPGGFTTRGEVVGGIVQALDEAARSGYRLDSRLIRGT